MLKAKIIIKIILYKKLNFEVYYKQIFSSKFEKLETFIKKLKNFDHYTKSTRHDRNKSLTF